MLFVPRQVFFEHLRQARLQPRRDVPEIAQVQVLRHGPALAGLDAVFRAEEDIARRGVRRDELDDLGLEAEDAQDHRAERIREDVAEALAQDAVAEQLDVADRVRFIQSDLASCGLPELSRPLDAPASPPQKTKETNKTKTKRLNEGLGLNGISR